jgi:hypothetical protein
MQLQSTSVCLSDREQTGKLELEHQIDPLVKPMISALVPLSGDRYGSTNQSSHGHLLRAIRPT